MIPTRFLRITTVPHHPKDESLTSFEILFLPTIRWALEMARQ
jgi:hypothetical protein